MEIHQKDNKTFTAYDHHFKTAAKQCAFENDTVATCIFVKGLLDAQATSAKIYEKDPQTLSEAITIVEKFSATQILTATLISSTVSIMSNDDGCFVFG